MKISINDILQSSNASLHDDGVMIFNAIQSNFTGEISEEIDVDFTGIKRCSTLFLNASFGKLLAYYGEDTVKKFIHPNSYDHILNFTSKYNDMWDNFVNKNNYQAYREEAFA